MKAAISYNPHIRYSWTIAGSWEADSCLTLNIAGDRAFVCSNGDGFLGLASACISLAQPGMETQNHFHLDDFFPFERPAPDAWSPDTFTILREKEVVDGVWYIDDEVVEAFGGDEEVDELIELADINLGKMIKIESGEEITDCDKPFEQEGDRPLRYASVDYQPCDEDGIFNQRIEIKGRLLMKVEGNDAYFEGDDRGLLSLASIFVAMAQPAMPEEGMLILDADMFAPGSFGHLELMRWSDWPLRGLKRTDEVPRAFLSTGYQLEDIPYDEDAK